ncbi:unnamed protein product [Zymoseptoria tritici ST99CH_1E4]|uniref:Uncharacterized protein n=1 Tax=Zymoseptoria tritici ST99CH_1E4 TaxID=1276532 RepID=A0A2H1FXE1_ZYMTR|nr:unnamed protein product [Zymoseptoria tritici ST99CH_1E4]
MLSVCSQVQMPTPSPNNDARKASAKKTPEKKVDLGAGLAKKRSQDFAAKIQGWNEAGGGVVQENDKVIVSENVKPKETKLARSKEAKVKESRPKEAKLKDEKVIASQDVIVVEVERVAVEDDGKLAEDKAKATPPRDPGVKKPAREIDAERKAWVRRKSKAQAEATPVKEVKEVSTPKKRVISDGHWRRDRVARETATSPEKEADKEKDITPKPVTVRRSIANVGLKVPPSTQDFVESDPDAETRRRRNPRRTRSRSLSMSADDRNGTPTYESSGTKIYVQRRRKSRQLDDDLRTRRETRKSASSTSNDKPSTSTDVTTPSHSPPGGAPLRPKSEPRHTHRKSRSREDERPRTARRSHGEEEPRRPSSGHKRVKTPIEETHVRRHPSSAQAYAMKITEQLKKSASPASPATPPKVYGTRIEGWLATMSDPFTESTEPSLAPAPLAIPRKKKSEPRVEDQPSEDRRKSAGDQRHSSRPCLKELDTITVLSQTISDDLSEISLQSASTGLKRRGARHQATSPVKDRFVRGSSPGNGDALMSGGLDPSPVLRSSAVKPRGPSQGKQRSSPTSVEGMATYIPPLHRRPIPSHHSDDMTTITEGSVLTRVSDGDVPRRTRPSRSRRPQMRDHFDLISELSAPGGNGHTTKRRSTRTRRAQGEVATIGDIMNDLSTDELKYQRELRTLVDGVIPVLLQHALSGKDTSSPSSRKSSRPIADPAVTKPIIDMGIALERLKTMHKRIPMHEPGELLLWADAASKVYMEYLRCWRLGFNDIVVNLAPAEQTDKRDVSSTWGHDIPRNKEGDLVDNAGERVDVAYLLKRPLVRIKYLAKTFAGITQLQPSANAEDLTARYQDLVSDAKSRVTDEQARLEDEAASSIDATRARDPRSLAPITGVTIDPTRSVRARDYFDMDLLHSSGQQLGCKIEIIYRDDAPNRGKGGDVLFCEVSTTGRWLLFPPIPHSLVSARDGDKPGELVVMIRGFLASAQQWREVMSLQADDSTTGADWTQMLGSSPMPSRLSKKSSFNMLKEVGSNTPGREQRRSVTVELADNAWNPSPREIEIPIGERAKAASTIWDGSEVNSAYTESTATALPKAKPSRYRTTLSSPTTPTRNADHGRVREYSPDPPYFYEKTAPARGPVDGQSRSKSEWTGSTVSTESRTEYSVWMPSSERYSDEDDEEDHVEVKPQRDVRPGMHRRTSSVPSQDMPTIPKVRKSDPPTSPTYDRDMVSRTEPASAPSKLQKRRQTSRDLTEPSKTPAPPTHSRPITLGIKTGILPSFTPAFLKRNRRPSSPLKHEYEPSTASGSLSESDYSDFSDVDSLTSESDFGEEVVSPGEVSTVGDLKDFHTYQTRPMKVFSPPIQPQSPPTHPHSPQEHSLTPSESASQGPYRSVPQTNVAPAKVVAEIFCWSDHGSWDSLHPEECQIFVTPGLIEAFDLAQANQVTLTDDGSTPSSKGVKPLVALELTPLVPLRRGTAVDISVRSPPTDKSLIRTGNNIMFRSRSPEETERLYALLNRARIDNPTYIALQNARGPVNQSNWGEVMDRRSNLRPTGTSWWNIGSRKASTYRSNGTRTMSVAATESSVGTMNTAFSALRRFSGGSKFFNIGKSTIQSRDGTRSSSNSDSLSSGVATPLQIIDPQLGTPLGIQNAKMRLYIRETAGKWKDLGSARLMIMLPPRPDASAAPNPRTMGMEKRVMVYGKSKGELLLDVTLGESAFERIARTGIAVSVYEESEHIGPAGGVLLAKTTIYMIQMKSERDAAYTFGLVGKLRY